MEYIYFIFLIVFILGGLLFAPSSNGASIWVSLIALIFVATPYYSHVDDLTTIKMADKYITVQRAYENRLIEQLNSLQSNETALMNSDTPAKSLIEAIAEAEKAITNRQVEKIDAEASINSRKYGLTAWVLWFF